MDQINASFTCNAPHDALCRQDCEDICDVWPCDHPTVDSGACLALEFLCETPAHDSYAGLPVALTTGPINLRWDGLVYLWTYLDAAPLPSPENDGALIRAQYGVPATIGARVLHRDTPATITGFTGSYLLLNGDGGAPLGAFHPTWQITYLP